MLNDKVAVSTRTRACMFNKKGALRNVKVANIIEDPPSTLMGGLR